MPLLVFPLKESCFLKSCSQSKGQQQQSAKATKHISDQMDRKRTRIRLALLQVLEELNDDKAISEVAKAD